MIFKEIDNIRDVGVICHYLEWKIFIGNRDILKRGCNEMSAWRV